MTRKEAKNLIMQLAGDFDIAVAMADEESVADEPKEKKCKDVSDVRGSGLMTRKELLEKAMEIVTKDRDNCYGEPEDNFRTIAKFWEIYFSETYQITKADVAALMILLKIARIATGKYNEDNWVDIAGYAACGAELQSKAFEIEKSRKEAIAARSHPYSVNDIINGCLNPEEKDAK